MFLAKRNTVALSLGGGGARGYAHIGAIREIESRGLEITAIAGTSMGAVVGAIYAAGKLDEFEKWARKLSPLDVVGLMDFSAGKAGAIRAERILTVVDDLLAGALIEDLSIPFTAVATNLLDNKEVLFQSGSATLALRASVAIPGVITPVMIGGQLLADGGMVNPVPVAPLAKVRAKKIIAIDLARGRMSNPFEREISEHFLSRTVKASRERVTEIAGKPSNRKLAKQLGVDTKIQRIVTPSTETPLQKIINDVPRSITSAEVMLMSVQTMQQRLTEVEFKKHRPDLVIAIPIDACGAMEFHKAKQMIELGRQKAALALESQAL